MQNPVPTNAALAIALAAAGVAVFPCQWEGEAAKRPVSGVYWRKEATAHAAQVAAWWRGYPQALPGHALGRSGLFVIDCDRHEGGADGVTAWKALIAEHGDPNAPSAATPSGGRHYYFRQPDDTPIGNSPGALPKGVDVRGEGGYVIAPGATMPDGRKYSDLPGFGLDAPAAPQWLLDLLRKPKTEAPPQSRPALHIVRPTTEGDARTRSYTETAFRAELDALSAAPKGRRNNCLNDAAFSIGTLVGAGWLGEHEARDTLLTVALTIGLARAESLATINSGISAGKQKPRIMPEDRGENLNALGAMIAASLIHNADGSIHDAATGEIYRESTPPVPEDTAWLEPGGLLGDIADWITDTARSPNRPLSVAAATSLLGLVLSRTLAGPTLASTHLYIACIGKSGCGKDWPQDCIAMILEACQLGSTVSSGKWKSDVAMENSLDDKPAQLAIIDEIGQSFFAPMMGKRAGSHQTGISAVLRKVWSAKFTTFYNSSSSAARRAHSTHWPALSIYGSSTPKEFYGCLSGDAKENGFLNRFLLVNAAPRTRGKRRDASNITVPDHIRNGVNALLKSGGNLESGVVAMTQKRVRDYDIMPWADGATCDAYEALVDECDAKSDDGEDEDDVYGRTAEMALRLASIHAASRDGRGASLTMTDWLWGKSLATASANFMAAEVSSRMVENDYHGKHKLVERTIREWCARIKEGIRPSELSRKIDGKFTERELDGILNSLAKSEHIAIVESRPTSGGRPSIRYLYLGERKAAA